MAASDADVEQLDRVLTRLASVTDEVAFAAVLAQLLPRLLSRMTVSLAAASRTKLLEILSHVNKRVKDRASVPLPLPALLEVLKAADTFGANFVLVYVRMALPRVDAAMATAALPIALGVAAFPEALRDFACFVVLRLAMLAPFPPTADDRRALAEPMLAVPVARANFLSFLQQTLLLQRPPPPAPPAVSAHAGGALGAGAPGASSVGAQAAAPPAQPQVLPPPPPGLSATTLARVLQPEGKGGPEAVAGAWAALGNDDMVRRKLTAVRWLTGGMWTDDEVFPALLVGSCDAHHEVVAACEDAVRRLQFNVDLQNPALVAALVALVVGVPGASGGGPPATSQASVAVRVKAVSQLIRSRHAASTPALMLQVSVCITPLLAARRLHGIANSSVSVLVAGAV